MAPIYTGCCGIGVAVARAAVAVAAAAADAAGPTTADRLCVEHPSGCDESYSTISESICLAYSAALSLPPFRLL